MVSLPPGDLRFIVGAAAAVRLDEPLAHRGLRGHQPGASQRGLQKVPPLHGVGSVVSN